MWMDDSNRGGGEPPHGHGPIVNVQDTTFVAVKLSLPGFDAEPDHPTAASFAIGICGHGQIVVDVRGCAILPLPAHTTFRERLVHAMNYALGRIAAPPPEPEDEHGA